MSTLAKVPQSNPPRETADPLTHVQDTRVLMRERSFPITCDVALLMRAIRDHFGIGRSTGTLLLDFNQGGLGSARFREEFSIDPELKISLDRQS